MLVREATGKTGYGATGTMTKDSKTGRTVVVTATLPEPDKDDYSGSGSKSKRDDRSDRSILNSNGIMRTNEVRVESRGAGDSESECNVYELHEV